MKIVVLHKVTLILDGAIFKSVGHDLTPSSGQLTLGNNF